MAMLVPFNNFELVWTAIFVLKNAKIACRRNLVGRYLETQNGRPSDGQFQRSRPRRIVHN